MVRYFRLLSSLVVIASLAVVDSPDSLAQRHNAVLEKLQQKLDNAKQRADALVAGKERALLCGYCHGDDGNSIKPDVPNLAGQNPDYLLEQIGRFAREERKDFVMNSLASQFSEEDQINLAIYYAGQTVKAGKIDRTRAIQGKQIYVKNCQACHGSKGRGKQAYARLAGQRQAYIITTLKRFRDNAGSPAGQIKRRSTVMEPIAGRLTDQDISNLAAYIASM